MKTMARLVEGTIIFESDEKGFARNSTLSTYRFLRDNNVFCSEYDSIFETPTLSREEFYAHHSNLDLWRLDYTFADGHIEIFETSHSFTEDEEAIATKPNPLVNWVFPEEPYILLVYWIKKNTTHEKLFSFLTCDEKHYQNVEQLISNLCRHFKKEGRKVEAKISLDAVVQETF
ncbi:hypothetical protein J4219_07690 [Candidatus Woesearchaeota archaeon]|nr:hypothetical protein [Candidatus Woesearchaeota archaeon]